jgi:hypothetical protein
MDRAEAAARRPRPRQRLTAMATRRRRQGSGWRPVALTLLALAALGGWWWIRAGRHLTLPGAGHIVSEEINDADRADLQRVLRERGAAPAE